MSTPEPLAVEASVALVCPHCGATLHINTEWEGQPYLQVQVPEAIECYATDCGAVWEPDGTPRTAPRWEAYPDLYDAPTRAIERAARLAAQPPTYRGPGSHRSQAEWQEWSNELALLIPEDDIAEYANPEGAQESIIEKCLRAYVEERAAQPPATDRDTVLELMALGRRAQNDPGQFVKRIYPDDYDDYERLDRWQARAVDAAVDSWLAARPAPDTLADRVQALEVHVTRDTFYNAARGGITGGPGVAWVRRDEVLALLAGRSDASPEGGA